MSNKFKKLTKTVISNVEFEEYDDEKIVVEKAEDVLPQDLIEKVNKIPFFPNHCTYNAYRVSYFIPEVDFVECLFGDNSDFTLNLFASFFIKYRHDTTATSINNEYHLSSNLPIVKIIGFICYLLLFL